MSLTVTPINTLFAIRPSTWDALNPSEYVFASYDFLVALELAEALTPNGWRQHHLIIHPMDAGVDQAIAALLLYEKNNSMGEFVFDFAWANAYEQYGLSYYPKLLSGIPFTPVNGPRLLCHSDVTHAERATLWALIKDTITALCQQSGFSSHHINFCQPDTGSMLANNQPTGYWRRQDTQYHWHNQGYQTFDDFLSTLTSKRRKNIRRERRLAAKAGFEIREYTGATLPESYWDAVYECYAITFLRHGRAPPLPAAVFRYWADRLRERLVIIVALTDDYVIAAALFFRDQTRLYGRYWGDLVSADSLHFELCYYRGIELCIRDQLAIFEPGAQGEHKIWRGFDPVTTHSLHYIAMPEMSDAIGRYLADEKTYALERQTLLQQHSAYRSDNNHHHD